MRSLLASMSVSAFLGLCLGLCDCNRPTTPPPIPSETRAIETAAPIVPVVGDPGVQGGPCGEGGACGPGLTCREYFGVAGARGPKFQSCEMACEPGKGGCPEGQACITMSDGPGTVCRPQDRVLPPPGPSDR